VPVVAGLRTINFPFTEPTPRSMLNVVAPGADHPSVKLAPSVIDGLETV